jgi:hypothetical protein
VKCAGIFGESFHGMPLLGFPPKTPPEGRSVDLISPAVAVEVGCCGAAGRTVRAVSIGWAGGGVAASATGDATDSTGVAEEAAAAG